MRVFIAAPDIFVGDAVGNHCLGIARALQRGGVEVNVHAQRFDGNSAVVQPLEQMFSEVGEGDTTLISYSIFDPFLDEILSLPGRKVVYFHGVTSPELLREFEPITADLCARSFAQFPKLAGADLVLANSRFTARSLSGIVPESKLRIMPPVVNDMPLFERTPISDDNVALPLDILVVGRLVPHKRIEDAIDVLSALRQESVDAQLTVVGSAPNAAYLGFLKGRVKDLGLDSVVRFTGVVTDQTLSECFDRTQVLLSTSLHEGFCVPVLEAMHLGVPTVVRAGSAGLEIGGGASMPFQGVEDASVALRALFGDLAVRPLVIKRGMQRAAEILRESSDSVWQSLIVPASKSDCQLN